MSILGLQENNSLLEVYPIGSIYLSVNSTNPAELFGGVWSPLDQGRVLIGAGASHPAGETGGEETHTLSETELPKHRHDPELMKSQVISAQSEL